MGKMNPFACYLEKYTGFSLDFFFYSCGCLEMRVC